MGAPDLVVPPALFDLQMRWLSRKGYTSLWMDELLAVRKKRACGRYIAIQFDDGYLDVLENAEPVLKQYGLKGTLFVSPGLLRNGPVHPHLPERKDLDASRFLSPEELLVLSQRKCIEIQAHGWTHRELVLLSGLELEAELVGTRQWLGRLLNNPVDFLCFPRDSRNSEVIEATLSSGFKGYTGGKRTNTLGENTAEVSRIYATSCGFLWVDMLTFKHDIWLFSGVYACWPLRFLLKKFAERCWADSTYKRVTP